MLRALLCVLIALCAQFSAARAETTSIERFGGKADGKTDNGPAFAKAFAFAATHPDFTLHLGGVCRILTAQAPLRPENRAAVTAQGVSRLTIEDGEVLSGGAFGAFQFEKCPGLTLRNVTFDYDPPIISQGRIIASDAASGTLTVAPETGYPSPAAFKIDKDGWFTIHKPSGDYGFFFVGFLKSALTLPSGDATLGCTRPDLLAAIAGHNDLRYAQVRRGYGSMLAFQFCDDLRMEGCAFYGTSGFASLFLFCNNAVLTQNRICVRSGSDRLISTSADGFHFIGARRGPRIEDNFFDRMEDDNIVISLRGNKIKSHHGAEVTLMPQSCCWYEKGDTIEAVSPTESMRREYRIVAMQPQAGLYQPPVLTLDRPLEGAVVDMGADFPTLVYNRSWRLDGAVIKHNTFRNTRRYAVFMGAGGVRIEDNTMDNFTGAALLLSHTEDLKSGAGTLNYYPSSDVVVRGNKITRAFRNGEEGRVFKGVENPTGAIELSDVTREAVHLGDLKLARNISIENNVITDSGGTGIYVANASDVTIAGNEITNANLEDSTRRCAIFAASCSNLTLERNRAAGSGIEVEKEVEP